MKDRVGKRSVYVFADWVGMEGPRAVGVLYADRIRGKEVFAFTYELDWLHSRESAQIDPALELFEGRQFLQNNHPNFGAFLDSAPDRWGRVLLQRREAAVARLEGRMERPLFESDYLLGVYDGHRMGGLRFKRVLEGPFLDDNAKEATPPWASLRELESASLLLEGENAPDDPEYNHWLNLLVAPGASLGGARPKASIVDETGALWMAKFPSLGDDFDAGAWEFVAHRLAKRAGIEVAECQIRRFSSQHHTFLARRFDRSENGGRIHFASAMTQLQQEDGQEGGSYLDLVDFITSRGGKADADLAQLFRRMVFNLSISNADDHLRNHGFLFQEGSWVLSPAYDLNPVETARGLHLNVSETDNALDWKLAMQVAPFFRLERGEALGILEEVLVAVQDWREEARNVGLSVAACERKAPAFRVQWLNEIRR